MTANSELIIEKLLLDNGYKHEPYLIVPERVPLTNEELLAIQEYAEDLSITPTQLIAQVLRRELCGNRMEEGRNE